jgi:hypothetical protein
MMFEALDAQADKANIPRITKCNNKDFNSFSSPQHLHQLMIVIRIFFAWSLQGISELRVIDLINKPVTRLSRTETMNFGITKSCFDEFRWIDRDSD